MAKTDLNRRKFLETLSAGAMGGAALSHVFSSRGKAQTSDSSGAWTPPATLTKPNILFIVVDQMRWPQWLNAHQLNLLEKQILPNIIGKLRNRSYVFEQYYTAATVCTAARGTLLTGLYAPQTAVYIDGALGVSGGPQLLSAYPTWGNAMQALAPAYANNCWWFGKWHLSACTTTAPLLPYGFNTRTYPGGPATNPSPNGWANEGSNGGEFTAGGPFNGYVFASDALIAGDFVGWLGGQVPPAAKSAKPWCATVSLINPHDITKAPAWLQSNPFPPTGVPPQAVYFPPPPFPPASGAPALYTKIPSPWNYENLKVVLNKPSLQYSLQKDQGIGDDKVASWVTFLNQYYWLQNYVDQQVGAVLTALQSSKYHNNTIVIFAADHGEFGGSHGLHDKGDAIYEESIHVPLYVHFPNQASMIPMDQMCSSVDFFGLMCDLATSGAGTWQQAYPDLANRQSIWSFLYQNAAETRIAPTLGIPYVFHTCDDDTNTPAATKFHIVGFRTKADPLNTTQPGAKLGIYSEWGNCSFVPDSTPPDYEFYDYNPATTNNWQELGNDYFSSNPTTQATIGEYLAELGSWGPPQAGLIASELNPPLVGTGTDGNPLSDAQTTARQNYLNYVYGNGACTE